MRQSFSRLIPRGPAAATSASTASRRRWLAGPACAAPSLRRTSPPNVFRRSISSLAPRRWGRSRRDGGSTSGPPRRTPGPPPCARSASLPLNCVSSHATASPLVPTAAIMDIEIITIGDELLLGFTIDTNAAHLAQELAGVGIQVVRRATVGDGVEGIAAAVREALDRTGAVITTGGLGPLATTSPSRRSP